MKPVFVPNKEELDRLIAGINSAYEKHFSFKISDAKSNKLRDCICEGLGFTNGGYQQLLSLWNADSESSSVELIMPSMPKNMSCLSSERSGHLESFIDTNLAQSYLLPYLKDNFPISPFYIEGYVKSGWISKSGIRSVNKIDNPIYFGTDCVGFSLDHSVSTFIQGALNQIYFDMLQIEDRRCLLLRQEKSGKGVLYPFSSIQFCNDKSMLVDKKMRIEFNAFDDYALDGAHYYHKEFISISPLTDFSLSIENERPIYNVFRFKVFNDRIELETRENGLKTLLFSDFGSIKVS